MAMLPNGTSRTCEHVRCLPDIEGYTDIELRLAPDAELSRPFAPR